MIICVVGPTGVGKTKLSVELAKKFNAIVVNCDAMQVYEKLNIGTAKPTKDEMQDVKHYLFDFVDVNYDYSVYDYQKDARKIIMENKDKNIVFVGGTGLYLKACLYDYKFEEEEKSNINYGNYSNEQLYKMALDKDKNHNIHQNNRQRLIRFLNKNNIVKEISKPLYNAIFIGLTTNRDNLYNRINLRVDDMVKQGLIEEVKSLYDQNIRSKVVNTAIGYKELYQAFDGKIKIDEALELIKKNSRHYAKRQYTWFKNQMDVKWFETNYDDFSKTIDEVEKYVKEKTN